MFLSIKRQNKHTGLLIIFCLLLGNLPAHAGGPPAPSLFSNPLAIALLLVMGLPLIVIAVLAVVLLGAADIKREQRKKQTQPATVMVPAVLLCIGLLCGGVAGAQEGPAAPAMAAADIGGMEPLAFYTMNAVIFLEFLIIIGLLYNIRVLIRKEKQQLQEAGLSEEAIKELRRSKLTWWDKVNKLKPVSQEAELDLGHEYDGIRELDNRLPPWWLYGFYVTIIVAIVYMWRFHISHTGPSSEEEYIASVEKAQLQIQEYLKKKGDAVDENTVVFLASPDDLAEGKSIFQKSCASCHKESGAGDVGPNLTDNFWLHGNDMKSVFKTIRYGFNAMPQWQNSYSNKQIAQVASYVKSLHGSNPAGAKAPQGIEMKEELAKPAADSTAPVKNEITIR